MSPILIQHYLNELSTLRRVSGTSRKSVVSEAFKTLLKDWGRSRGNCSALEWILDQYKEKTPKEPMRIVEAMRAEGR